jgi:hypothetical protein
MDHLAHLRANDRVTIRRRQPCWPEGEYQESTGKVNPLLMFPTHVIINTGGKYGTPAIADNGNIVRCSGCKRAG